MITSFLDPPVEKINSAIALNANVELYILRLDLIHPEISGNKWFKLKYNILAAQEQQCTSLLTFGGAYSNHIYATAAAGNLFGFRTIGMIRGEERLPLNHTLDFAISQGMQIVYLDRQTYRQRDTPELHQQLKQQFGEVFIIPEGGSNLNGIKGCTEIITAATIKKFEKKFDSIFNTICVACGTATTAVGLVLSLEQKQKVIGFPVLKGGEFLADQIKQLGENYLGLTCTLGITVQLSLRWIWENHSRINPVLSAIRRRTGYTLRLYLHRKNVLWGDGFTPKGIFSPRRSPAIDPYWWITGEFRSQTQFLDQHWSDRIAYPRVFPR
jgi:1-aminocyclopropane-1-carboxylate deaminase